MSEQPQAQPPLTASLLAKILYEELDRDDWGDIDPHWIKEAQRNDIDTSDDPDDPEHRDIGGMKKVLERVVERINNP